MLFGARIPDILRMVFVRIIIKILLSGWMISVAICQANCLFSMHRISRSYGSLPVTTRQALCLCTCSSGSRYLRRHASSITDVHMFGYVIIATICLYVCITFPEDYGLLPVTTRQILC